jgi:hypothetical protein
MLSLLLCFVLPGLICVNSFAGKITVDPNTGGASALKILAAPDARLAQTVTYEARYVAVRQILEDLTAMTGVKLNAGVNKSDWQVRSRKMNIFAKDVRLSDMMNSIAHTMKFAWSRNDDVTPPTYRLKVDSKAVGWADGLREKAETRSEELWKKRRKDWIDIIMKEGALPPQQIEATRYSDPVFYRYARGGALCALNALFNEVPKAKDRFAAGENFRISVDELSEETRELLFSAADEFRMFMQRGRLEVIGFGIIIKPDDSFDIAYARLDTNSFTPNRRWGLMSQGSTGYFHISKGEWDPEIVDLKDKDADWTRALCERENLIIDTNDRESSDVTLGAHYPKLKADLDNEEESLYPSEPLNEHSDSPSEPLDKPLAFDELEKTIKLRIEVPKTQYNNALVTNKYIASFQKALADATGMSVVSDSWVSVQGGVIANQEATLRELLERFSTQFNYNWDKSSTILEFRHRKWWKNRLNQIPDEWVTAWSENTRNRGVLSLDDLAQISCLTYDQAEESLKPDMVLGSIYGKILSILEANGNLHWLRLYSTLSSKLRVQLVGRWVSGAMLSFDQWKLAQVMFDRIGSLRSDALFSLRNLPDDSALIYEFREFEVDSTEEDRKWVVTLPRYVPPISGENPKP